jgi:hypothetical protein
MISFKSFLLPLLLLQIQAPAGEPTPAGQLRTWTDSQGRTLRATLMRSSGTMMRMVREDGTRCDIHLERLAPEDQKIVRAWMVEHPAAVEYDFGVSGLRKPDGTWEVAVANRGANTLEDLEWTGRFFDGGTALQPGLPQRIMRLEPGQRQVFTLPAPVAGEFATPGLQIRLCRKNAVVWEWITPGRTAPAWPLEPEQVRVPAKGLPPASILAALAPVGSGSGRLGVVPELPAPVKQPGEEEGEDLVKLFESP